MEENNDFNTLDLGYIYPFMARFCLLFLQIAIVSYVYLFSQNFNDYIVNYVCSKLNLIVSLANILIISYNSGIQINTKERKYKKYSKLLGLEFGYWVKIPAFEYFTISYKNKNVNINSNQTINSASVSYSKFYLNGFINNKPILIHEDYQFKICLDVAMFFRNSGIDIPIYDLLYKEPVEL